jgi:hypothetical protein
MLTCQVVGPRLPSLESNYNIIMLAQPVVNINPLTLAVRDGDTINITCSAYVPSTSHPNIKPPRIYWYRNQVLLGEFIYYVTKVLLNIVRYDIFGVHKKKILQV